MSRTHWTWLTVAGLGMALGAFTGCENGQSREAGRQVGKAAKDVREGAREAAEDVKSTSEQAAEGFKEGMGGSGSTSDAGTPDASGHR
ncbi:hypothetical protein [Myxococcus landrumensis]|uniref:Lipoprotein n=1 Tax=Myxococcus landrumensis TaxID=2813577 RepID=A0ABX7NBA1_9BACT|nr:hypothetical protein [Myxococcus landrumus]QSQ16062.1 hypothetical protein JY572_08440 [Myxococcus landrumus]